MNKLLILSIFLSIVALEVRGQASVVTGQDFHSQVYTTAARPRGLFLDDSGDVLVLEAGANQIFALFEEPENTVNKVSVVSAAGLGLNHGITYKNGYIYASSPSSVYRWAYEAGSREMISEAAQTVVRQMPTPGHSTRTVILDEAGQYLYVSVGSNANVDQDSSRSRIIRFDISNGIVDGGFTFQEGEVFADGLRNEVGLAWDLNGVLWGVENGADMLNHPDLGGDIHNGNPAEEMNKFDKPVGTHYGYPYCWSVHNLPGYAPGEQFAWPSFMDDGTHDDEWCNNKANNQPPTLAMAAHNAPLGIEFYDGRNCEVDGGFPCSARGDSFVSFHGSWNSVIKVGYRVSWVRKTRDLQDLDIIKDTNAPTCLRCFRPVNSVFNNKGHLIVSADSTGEIFRITYGQEPAKVVQGISK